MSKSKDDTVKRNPIAKDLFTAKYKPRVVKSKKAYDRKKKDDE